MWDFPRAGLPIKARGGLSHQSGRAPGTHLQLVKFFLPHVTTVCDLSLFYIVTSGTVPRCKRLHTQPGCPLSRVACSGHIETPVLYLIITAAGWNVIHMPKKPIQTIKKLKIEYLGHALRYERYMLFHLIMIGKVDGKRRVGRRCWVNRYHHRWTTFPPGQWHGGVQEADGHTSSLKRYLKKNNCEICQNLIISLPLRIRPQASRILPHRCPYTCIF